LTGKGQLVLLKSSFQSLEKLSAKDNPEYLDGQKKLVSAGNPAPMIWREPSPRDHAMHMGMMKESLAPSVQNGEKPDFGAEVLGIGSDLE
jgi:hypothetical protein